ncbi:hypothetical protein BDN70DRAFT_887860 [Pholiota conissans]|uniref:Uncharacterized protein n=1 Tax=Pholiota conissans TaxID=109636 RepID=A0A9P6CLW6_9AGAR|nr:hypothetical protein BDN70DRAFT_887860 [Pholiota conissans]
MYAYGIDPSGGAYDCSTQRSPIVFIFSLPPLFLSFSLVSRMKSDPNSDARTATLPVRQTTTHISHAVHSTRWHGAGNIYPGDEMRADVIDEEVQRNVTQERGWDAFHSTGRGGFANHSSAAESAVEHHSVEHGEYESMGRGEVGNIVHDTGKERAD